MRRFTSVISAVLVIEAALVTTAVAKPASDGFLGDLVAHVRDALERASLERAPKPPVPVSHSWRTKNRGAVEIGAPLLAMEAVDLDGVAGEELVLLTTLEVIVLRVDAKPSVIARAALPDAAATIRSRDPIGTISVERGPAGATIAVRTSEQENGARYRLEAGKLGIVAELPEALGYPLCSGISARPELGRNHFDPKTLKADDGAWPANLARPERPFYRLECRELIGSDGRPNRVVAYTGLKREISVGCQRGSAACPADTISAAEVTSTGDAFEVADLNRDGSAEIAASYGHAPRTDDNIRVYGRAGKLLQRKKFDASIIAIAAVDIAGDGRRHLFFAVRQSSDKRINLWTLNRHQ